MVDRTHSRRAILAGLTAGGVATAAAAAIPAAALVPLIPVTAPAPAIPVLRAAPVQPENPELLALGDEINPLLATYRAALARYTDARAAAEASCPTLPEELVCKRPQWEGCVEREVDVEGKDIWPPNYVHEGKTNARQQRAIFNSVAAKAAIEQGNIYCDGRTKSGKQLQKLIRTAEQYEAERKDAIERSGVLDVAAELSGAAIDIDSLAWKVRGIAPVTMAGVLVQARMLAANAQSETYSWGHKGRAGSTLGQQLADAVLRVQGEVGGSLKPELGFAEGHCHG